jgi:hypothetical protein
MVSVVMVSWEAFTLTFELTMRGFVPQIGANAWMHQRNFKLAYANNCL